MDTAASPGDGEGAAFVLLYERGPCLNGTVVDDVLKWLMPLFLDWGYLIVFAGVALESFFLTGWIAPGTTVVLIASFYSAHGTMNVYMIWATVMASALLGDNLGFLIGRRMGRELEDRYRSRPRFRKGMGRVRRFFSRYGAATVLFGRLLSGVDAFIPLAAGSGGMPHAKYVLYDAPAIVLWSGLLCALGYFLGENWRAVDRFIGSVGWGLLAAVALALLIVLAVRRGRGKSQPAA